MKRTALILSIAALAASCGRDDEGSNSDEGVKPPLYAMTATTGNIPFCTEENDNQLIYVEDKGVFQSCKDRAWKEIDLSPQSIETRNVREGEDGCENGGIKVINGDDEKIVCNGEDGEQGDKGEAGEDGEKGEAGEDGAAGKDGESGVEITERWLWDVNSYVGSNSISTEAVNVDIRLGGIEVTLLSNGHFFATVNLNAYDAGNDSHDDITHTMFFTNSDKNLLQPQTQIKKVMQFNFMTVSYTFQKKADGQFEMSATVDVNDNYNDNGGMYVITPLTRVY